ncbi:Osmotically-inducible protein OsmY, contains BON domain [Noviherbaspirillum humi]|uniref:Osmotically-inducible protein OsmY, contains BON domain n=1 Tax=Noviherbaspirillum humi TaxID=1688639 RepID=A0A239G9X0_9BURK|nr:BON domain-containing protein [Noviherbaspirillum humi]SNS65233.1 Osmotically-inducible protein OsmY, contains BON domain [Noviherbaspirillum humi]
MNFYRLAKVVKRNDALPIASKMFVTDADIKRRCEHALEKIKASRDLEVTVMVTSGWVMLSGTVAHGGERWAAEEAVSSVPGVLGVNAQIRVRNLDLEDEVRGNVSIALADEACPAPADVGVKVEQKRATLSGFVHSPAQRRAARNAAESTQGIKEVIDDILLI